MVDLLVALKDGLKVVKMVLRSADLRVGMMEQLGSSQTLCEHSSE